MTEDDLKARVSWAIEYVCNKNGEYRYSNDTLGAEMGIDKGTISSYRLKRTAPGVVFCVDFCKKFNKFSYDWLTLGKGEPFKGAREKYPEVCGPEERQPRELQATISGEQTAYQYNRDEEYRAFGQLKAIFNSGDPPTIRAIVANLDVFAHGLDRKQKNAELQNKIAVLERRLDRLETESRREGGKNQGDATDDGHDCPIEKKVM